MPNPNDSTRFWLLLGEAPTGPFSIDEIHSKLAAGTIRWATLACPLGKSEWSPLSRTSGVGPSVSSDAPSVRERPSQSLRHEEPLDLPADPTPASKGQVSWSAVVVAGVILAVGGWVVYGWVRPLGPREVCERVDKCKTAKEAQAYCTANLWPLLEEMYRSPEPVNNGDYFEFTQDGDAPASIGGYYVGFGGKVYVPEAGRRVKMNGVFHLIKSDGWKIDDAFIMSVDGQPLPEPMSLADMARAEAAGQSQVPTKTAAASNAKSWYQNPSVARSIGGATVGWLMTGGGKVLVVGIGVAIAGIVAWLRSLAVKPPARS